MCVQQSTCVQNGLCRIVCVHVTVRAGVNMCTYSVLDIFENRSSSRSRLPKIVHLSIIAIQNICVHLSVYVRNSWRILIWNIETFAICIQWITIWKSSETFQSIFKTEDQLKMFQPFFRSENWLICFSDHFHVQKIFPGWEPKYLLTILFYPRIILKNS